MIQLEKVNKYIEDLKFKKKTMGGIDELDALSHMKDICEIYEEELENLKAQGGGAVDSEELSKKDEIIESLKKELEQVDSEKEKYRTLAMEASDAGNNGEEIERLQEKINTLMADNENLRRAAVDPQLIESKDREIDSLKAENDRLKDLNTGLAESVRKAEQELDATNQRFEVERRETESIRAEYEQKHNEIKELSDYILQVRKDAKDRAEAQANQIIGQANMDAQTVREESLIEKRRLESEIEEIRQTKNNMKRSVYETMQRYEDLLRRMNSEMQND